MRAIARKPPGPLLAVGEVVDGYVVESLVADRGHSELICDAVGLDAQAVTLAVAWRQPVDRHAWPRFRRLARTRASLEHEALVPVHAVGDHSGRPYLAMDRYPEATFAELLGSAPLPARQVLTLLAPVCDALDLAHANGLVHQSLSDTSLLMKADSLFLDGFGLAGGPRELSFQLVGVHEVRYCPPEELRGEPLEPASNVYSLTSLLVHAITGTTPYHGAQAAQAYGHLLEPPPRPSAHMRQLGSAFDDVVAHGMAKEPGERPASAGALLREAAAALGVELPKRHASGEGQESGHLLRGRRGRRRGRWGGAVVTEHARVPERDPERGRARDAQDADVAGVARREGRLLPARVAYRDRSAAVRIRRVPGPAVAVLAIAAAIVGLAVGVVLDPFDGGRASAAGPSVDARALGRLDDQRTPLRATLASSETPQEQAAAAAELAGAYGRVAEVAESPRLASAARAAERAYEDLEAAAGAGSAEQFAAASDGVTRADARLASIAAGSR